MSTALALSIRPMIVYKMYMTMARGTEVEVLEGMVTLVMETSNAYPIFNLSLHYNQQDHE